MDDRQNTFFARYSRWIIGLAVSPFAAGIAGALGHDGDQSKRREGVAARILSRDARIPSLRTGSFPTTRLSRRVGKVARSTIRDSGEMAALIVSARPANRFLPPHFSLKL